MRRRVMLVLQLVILTALCAGGAGDGGDGAAGGARRPGRLLRFDGLGAYVEAPDAPELGVDPSRSLTVAAWLRPDTLTFPRTDGSGWVHWLGKGEGAGPAGRQEWAFRMYSQGNAEGRANRISFYVFNPAGGQGIGSYFQDPVEPGRWIHVVGTVDAEHKRTAIYKDGRLRDCDQYQPDPGGGCNEYPDGPVISPAHGPAPLRLGHRDGSSYFQGALAEVRLWSRALSEAEVAALYATGQAPRPGLVAEYRLDEGRGAVAHDRVGRHDGLIVGASWERGPRPPAPGG